MNNISNNSYSRNTYGTSNINIENNNIKNNVESKVNINQLSKTDDLKNKDVEKFIKRIHDEVQKAQLIAINIVKGKKITKEELEFITKKYPDLKKIADESIKDYKNLIKKLENCKTHEERQQVISKVIKEISNMVKNGYISEVQSKVKMSSIEDAIKFSEKIKLEIEKAETIALKIIKGEKITSNEEKFINEKHPNIKQIVEETIKEAKNLKSDLKNCKTNQERNKLLLNATNDLEDKNKKGLLSKTEIKIKMSSLEEIKKLELITMKIIKGEKLAKSEEKLINEKYPYIKQEIQDEIKEYQNTEKKNQILFNELKEQIKKGEISETQARIKMEIIENIKKENEEKERTREESLNSYINPYIYIFLNIFGNNLGFIIAILLVVSVIYFF